MRTTARIREQASRYVAIGSSGRWKNVVRHRVGGRTAVLRAAEMRLPLEWFRDAFAAGARADARRLCRREWGHDACVPSCALTVGCQIESLLSGD